MMFSAVPAKSSAEAPAGTVRKTHAATSARAMTRDMARQPTARQRSHEPSAGRGRREVDLGLHLGGFRPQRPRARMTVMRRNAMVFGLVVSLMAGASPAAGAGGSRPATLLTQPCAGYCSPAPEVAVNRAGTVVALYRQDKGFRNFVRIGDRRGRFGRAQALPKRSYPGNAA